MNLVLSGPITANLRNEIVALSAPCAIKRLNKRAERFEGVLDDGQVRAAVSARCATHQIDHAYIDEGSHLSGFRLLAIDMDSTLITIECIDELADFAGTKADVSALTEATMQGTITNFEESLRRRVELLKGMDADVLRRVFNERLKITPGGRQLIAACAVVGIRTLLVSGGFDYFAGRVKSQLEIDESYANTLEINAGRLTGRIVGHVVDGNAKKQRVTKVMECIGCKAAELLVVGDGANDIPMMRLSDNSIAFHAKAKVDKVARHAIRYGTLGTVLDYFHEETLSLPVF